MRRLLEQSLVLVMAAQLLVGQNVGIGTGSPQTRLHVHGAGGVTGGIRITSTGANSPTVNFYAGTATPNAGHISFGDNTGWKFHITRSSDGLNLLTVQDNGNVGIGTVNPSVRLEVSGNLMLYNGNTDGARLIWRGGTGGIQEYRTRVFSDGRLSFFPVETGSPGFVGEVLVLTQAGNVGIGVVNPAQRLHVGGTIRSDAIAGAHPGTMTYSLLGTNTSGDIQRVNPIHNHLYTYVVVCDFTVEGTVRSSISSGVLVIDIYNESGNYVKRCVNLSGVAHALVNFLIVNDDTGNCGGTARVSGVRSFAVTNGGGLATIATDLGCNGSDGNNMIFFIHYNPL